MKDLGLQPEFRKYVDQLAVQRDVTLNYLCQHAEELGPTFTDSWLRDRYYGRTTIKRKDCDKLAAILSASAEVPRLALSVEKLQNAVDAMCAACAGDDAYCWDRKCPLRPVSPLPVRPKR
jgi:hypothetical protein